jgi:phenylalanyl-tRNA synthetase alpha chain
MILTPPYIAGLLEEFTSEQKSVATTESLEAMRRKWLGKEGVIKELFKQLREVAPEERPAIAAGVNALRDAAETFVRERESSLKADVRKEALSKESIDLSLPADSGGIGGVHPITYIERKIITILRPFGFQVVDGPEVEEEYFCFDALNIPPHHPARDMQDTFYTSTGHVLRTHTTSVQSRVLAQGGAPLKVASFGRVYRNETEDASHQAMFHQFELIWLEKGLTLAHLTGLIEHILKGIYGKRRKVRFVPKFYPYTEPSIGPQIDCAICKGAGCSSCGGSGWVTIAGAGMIHRNVLTEFKYNPDEISGFAFGLGTSRLASQFCNIPTLKAVYENDLRVLVA